VFVCMFMYVCVRERRAGLGNEDVFLVRNVVEVRNVFNFNEIRMHLL